MTSPMDPPGSATEADRSAEPARVRDRPGAIEYHRTITASEIASFTSATGDDNRVHMDLTYAVGLGLPDRVAHGILVQGLMSTACTRWCEREGLEILSYGWERVRFIKPVIVGDTITAAYALADPLDQGKKRRAVADAHNQRGELVAVGTHILYVVA